METEKVIRHQSFGTIRASRVTGESGFMFGSDVTLNGWIQIEISKNSSVEYDKTMGRRTHPSYNNADDVVQIKMTPAQFAEFITTLNIGEGVPCTISKVNGHYLEQFNDEVQCRADYEIEKLRKSLKGHRVKFKNATEKITSLIDKLPKKRQEEILRIINGLKTEVCNNTPFYLDTLTEVVEEVTATAKTEIASYLGIIQSVAGLPLDKSVDTSRLLTNK